MGPRDPFSNWITPDNLGDLGMVNIKHPPFFDQLSFCWHPTMTLGTFVSVGGGTYHRLVYIYTDAWYYTSFFWLIWSKPLQIFDLSFLAKISTWAIWGHFPSCLQLSNRAVRIYWLNTSETKTPTLPRPVAATMWQLDKFWSGGVSKLATKSLTAWIG